MSFILMIFGGLTLLWPALDYQPLLSQGDHGRDLFAFLATARDGAMPYRDYWWVYGPLMPYYYSIFFKIFGATITSILLGKYLLFLLSGCFIFLILCLYISPVLGCLGGLWFFIYSGDFFYTFNHVGGIFLSLVTTYCLLLYLKTGQSRHLLAVPPSILLLTLVKINFGFAALLITLCGLIGIHAASSRAFTPRRLQFYLVLIVSGPALGLFIYFLFLHDQPLYYIRQCLPYLSTDHPHNAPLYETLRLLLRITWHKYTQDWINGLLGGIILLCCVPAAQNIIRMDSSKRKEILFAIAILAGTYVLFLHEFLFSGVPYRLAWTSPYSLLLLFLALGLGIRKLTPLVRGALYTMLATIIVLELSTRISALHRTKFPSQFLDQPTAQVYVGNQPAWIRTVKQTTLFLEENLKDDETFFALPYDPIYPYLTKKDIPTPLTIFFEHINIPTVQEMRIIDDLQKKDINWIVISNRSVSSEKGLGVFGETHCPLLGQYIRNNFTQVAEFGEWSREPGWAWDHGTRILKRK